VYRLYKGIGVYKSIQDIKGDTGMQGVHDYTGYTKECITYFETIHAGVLY